MVRRGGGDDKVAGTATASVVGAGVTRASSFCPRSGGDILAAWTPSSGRPRRHSRYIRDGMVVGLGTGSTADFFLVALGEAVRSGRLRGIRGVPTSVRSERRARELGIPLATLVECPRPDVTVDGADEVAPDLDLIKGLGGALLREKIVAQNSAKLVIIADAGKTVPKLGTKSKLPVEVAKFAHETHEAYLRKLRRGAVRADGERGHAVRNRQRELHLRLRLRRRDLRPLGAGCRAAARAGVVETGLFLGMASVALIAGPDGSRGAAAVGCSAGWSLPSFGSADSATHSLHSHRLAHPRQFSSPHDLVRLAVRLLHPLDDLRPAPASTPARC